MNTDSFARLSDCHEVLKLQFGGTSCPSPTGPTPLLHPRLSRGVQGLWL